MDIAFKTFFARCHVDVFARRKKLCVGKFWISILNKMRFINHIILFLLVPGSIFCQTVNVDSNRIVYKGTVMLDKINKQELYGRAKNAMLSNVKGGKEILVMDNSETGMIAAQGSIRLASPHHIIKTVEYIFEVSVEDGKYEYRIDSVYLKEVERGGKPVKTSSEELLKGMDVTGPFSAIAEKQLNEIDMYFQKLIAIFKTDMKAPVKKNTE